MKVIIANNNAPRPLGDQATGGLISGASGLLGSTIDAIAGAVNAKKQREHDKEMAGINQQNILAQMEQQNAYQVAQWERENAYNDPSAVAARYRKAGINPRAAFGTGSASGAGISGGLSGAPSGSSTGSSSNSMFGTHFAGLGHDVMAGVSAGIENQRAKSLAEKEKAEANKASAEAKVTWLEAKRKEYLYTEDYFNAEKLSKLSDAARTEAEAGIAQLKKVQEQSLSAYYDVMNAATARERVAAADRAEANVKKVYEEIDNLHKVGILTDEQANEMRAKTRTEGARYEVEMARANHFKALAKVAEADAELKGEQARKITHDIIQGYISAGADVISCITDVMNMLSPILGLGKAKRVAERIVTEEYDAKGKVKGKTVRTTDNISGYTNTPH